MRLILPAIFPPCSAQWLVKYEKICPARGHRERQSLGDSSATPHLLFVTQVRKSIFQFQHLSAPVLCTSLKYSHWYNNRLPMEGEI